MPIPSVTPSGPPSLLSPNNGEKFYGSKKRIPFTFQPFELGANEWYRLQIDFRDRKNEAASWCGWSKGTTILFPSEYHDDSWQIDRTFRWHVNVAISDADPPSTCDAPVSSMSAPSEERLFYWY